LKPTVCLPLMRAGIFSASGQVSDTLRSWKKEHQ
jgi:hypothetical protein